MLRDVPQSDIRVGAYYHRTNGRSLTEADVNGQHAVRYANFEAFQLRNLFYDAAYDYAPKVMARLAPLANRFQGWQVAEPMDQYGFRGFPAPPGLFRWLESNRLESCIGIRFDLMNSLLLGREDGEPYRLRAAEDLSGGAEDLDTIDVEIYSERHGHLTAKFNARNQTLAEVVRQVQPTLKDALRAKLEPIFRTAELLGISKSFKRKAQRDARWTVAWHFHDLTPLQIADFETGVPIPLRDGGELRRHDAEDIDGEGTFDDDSKKLAKLKFAVPQAVQSFADAIGLVIEPRQAGRPTALQVECE